MVAISVALVASCHGNKKPPPPIDSVSPETPIPELPDSDGKVRGHQSTGPDPGGGWLNRVGEYESMTGTFYPHVGEWNDLVGTEVSVVISVESGTLRAYVQDLKGKGYHYVEATPGHPAQTRGNLIFGGGNLMLGLRALAGEARGVKWHAWGSNR